MDPTFGQGGVVIDQVNVACLRACVEFAGSYARALALQPDGKILLGGEDLYIGSGVITAPNAQQPVPPSTTIVRLGANGVPETQFGNAGRVEDFPFESFPLHLYADGRNGFLALGENGVERYTSSGFPDDAFGPEGVRRLAAAHAPLETMRDAAGRIVALGKTSPQVVEVVRYLPSGARDPRFGTRGAVRLHGLPRAEPIALATEPDGGVIVVGGMHPPDQYERHRPLRLFVARLRPDGRRDRSFGERGVVWPPITNIYAYQQLSVAVAPAGDIVLAAGGSIKGRSGREALLLARYTSTGRLDRAFGDHGIVAHNSVFFGGSEGESESEGGRARLIAHAITFDSAGDTIVAGEHHIQTIDTGSAGTWFLARYTSHGLDCSFGTHGIVSGNYGSASAVAVQPNGRIVIAGDSHHAFMAARYMGGGTPRTCRA